MKITSLAKPGPDARTQKTFQTQQSPSMRDKIAAAQKAPPPPGGMPPPNPQALTQEINIEGQAPALEAPKVAPNPQLAELARQTRLFRKAQQEFLAEKAAWQQQQAEYIRKSDLTADPLKRLAEAGVNYDRLTELQLSQLPSDPVQALQAEIQSLKAQLAADKETAKTAEQQRDIDARQQAEAVIAKDAELLANSDPAYELTKATKSHGDVAKLISSWFDKTGEMLTVNEAATWVEEQLLENKVKEFQTLSALEKMKAKLAPAEPTALPEQQPIPQPWQAPQVRTLNNQMSTQQPLSARQRGIQAFLRAQQSNQ